MPAADESGNYANRFTLYFNATTLRTFWAPRPDTLCCLWIGIPQPLGWVTATTTAHKVGGEPMNKMINICDETGCWGMEKVEYLNYWTTETTLELSTVFSYCKSRSYKQTDLFSSVLPFIINNF